MMTRRKQKLYLLAGIAGTFLIFILWKLAAPVLAANCSSSVLQFLNAAAILSLCFPSALILVLSGEGLHRYFPAENLPKQLAAGLLIGLCMFAILGFFPMLLGIPVYQGNTYSGIPDALGGLIYFVLIVGLSEEFIFRGFIHEKLDAICLTDGMPILLSSALFGLFHFSGFNITQVLLTGLIGAFFCICKKQIPHCTILSLAIAHGLYDWLLRLSVSLQ